MLPTFSRLTLRYRSAGVAQLVEQLTCNQPVGGSTPLASSIYFVCNWGFGKFIRYMLGVDDVLPFTQGFPSGQRDQTVTLTRKLRWFESTPLHQILYLVLLLFNNNLSTL